LERFFIASAALSSELKNGIKMIKRTNIAMILTGRHLGTFQKLNSLANIKDKKDITQLLETLLTMAQFCAFLIHAPVGILADQAPVPEPRNQPYFELTGQSAKRNTELNN
jgi:hypothetical protein